jgi:hypothetical protein
MDCAMNKTAGRCLAARYLATLGFGVALCAMTTADGWAQGLIPGMPTGTGNIAAGRRAPSGAQERPPEPPPDAVPGARSRQPVAPMTRAAGDMQPTEALFDAINRGDIAAARDAITRGADLRGRNILGMSPMELSIDLGRNDISFLLLSMRGGDDGRNRQAQPATAAAKGAPARQARQVQAPVHAPRVTASRGVPASAQQPVPSQTARLFSGDGGTPVPNAGFLGFDSGRR